MILPILGVGALFYLLIPTEPGPPPYKCRDRRKSKEPYCSKDSECTWTPGLGCTDKDPGRYFTDDKLFQGEEKQEKKLKFCRCVLHVMANSDYKPKRAYQICARSVGTTTGGRPCMYDWDRIPEDEIRGYISTLEKKGIMPTGMSQKEIKTTRKYLKEWYHRKKSLK